VGGHKVREFFGNIGKGRGAKVLIDFSKRGFGWFLTGWNSKPMIPLGF